MADYTRLAMPSEFYDITSAMLLTQPEPEYLYARLIKSALNLDLTPPDELGLDGRTAGSNGAPYATADEGRLELSSPITTELIAGKVEMDGMPGHTVRFNRPVFTNSTYTVASRLIARNAAISTTSITVSGEQVPLTLQLFGGPYDNTQAAVAPYGIDAFDARLGVHKASKIVGLALKRDFDRFLDAATVVLLDLASAAVRPAGFATDAAMTVNGCAPLTYEQLTRATRTADDANLPRLSDGKRVFVCTPTGKRQLKNDGLFAKYAQFESKMNPLLGSGWFGTLDDMHCFQSNTLTTAVSGSISVHSGHLIAPGALLAGMGQPPKVVANTNDNYATSIKVIWLSALALGLADNRFCVNVRYSCDA